MMKLIQLYLLVCTCVVLSAGQETCRPGWTQNDNNCYWVGQEDPWGKDPNHFWSQGACEDEGAHLAIIESEEENNFLKSWLNISVPDSGKGVWTDGKHRFTGWSWNSIVQKMVFTDWVNDPAMMRGYCMMMSRQDNYAWLSVDCDKNVNMSFVCQYELCQQPSECFQGSCYSLHCRGHSPEWDDGNDHCPDGTPAKIESKEENDFIQQFLSKSEDFVEVVWTSGYAEDGDDNWTWRDNDPVSGFTNWYQSSNPYMDIRVGSQCLGLAREHDWQWQSISCVESHPILCEKPDTRTG